MKRSTTISATILFVMFVFIGCNQSKPQSESLIIVDVTNTDYPIKELILQDFMDVEYIALETNDDFINQGFVQSIGQKIIVVKNGINDGDIFIYRRKTGEADNITSNVPPISLTNVPGVSLLNVPPVSHTNVPEK